MMSSTLTLRPVKNWEKLFPGDRLEGKGSEGSNEDRGREAKAEKKTAA